ncbi:D-aminoacyl-tRNA deacylase [Oceanidesulfovibrio marinus]|uniref:D-aminoacyl-tRNA deacylase n=1 Tax=Oceanidesulfovibrio marinus TaxID=370038 RepID=A0A6M4XFB0_9BACT|nr:D-aminoacyl-tRNA deacylase [Oceanidesulfovibrio marinus]QJT08836.1 D-tyrosyl-tRNA(Tyr) deacylase [Oceanidesulfovibrio marinus]TVM36738.1 D-tyrosyl-tRNA(Tyr) deacylase [Oceanidesulfovibrio marinus]
MRIVAQRVKEARVDVAGETVGRIDTGILALVGFGAGDGPELPGSKAWRALLSRLLTLRIFPDDQGRFNLGLGDVEGGLLLVSQFTLYADCRKGRRPSFTGAAAPELAAALFERFVQDATAAYPGQVEQGVFAANMDVSLVNWGPVTITLDGADFA